MSFIYSPVMTGVLLFLVSTPLLVWFIRGFRRACPRAALKVLRTPNDGLRDLRFRDALWRWVYLVLAGNTLLIFLGGWFCNAVLGFHGEGKVVSSFVSMIDAVLLFCICAPIFDRWEEVCETGKFPRGSQHNPQLPLTLTTEQSP